MIGLAWIGSNDGGLGFVGLFGIAAIVWSLVGYYAGDRMVLSVSGARRISHEAGASASGTSSRR